MGTPGPTLPTNRPPKPRAPQGKCAAAQPQTSESILGTELHPLEDPRAEAEVDQLHGELLTRTSSPVGPSRFGALGLGMGQV